MSSNTRTALGFNTNQALHYNTINAEHPEHPNRIHEICSRLESTGLYSECLILKDLPPLDNKLLEQVHSATLSSYLYNLKSMNPNEINKFARKFDSVTLTKDSFDVALRAAECVVHMTHLLIEDKIDNGFALVRPPGHHSQQTCLNGFCILNNVALAAKEAENLGVKRILIIDFDVHHGQGTQYQFYESRDVLYVSVHRYEHGAYWPHLRESDFDFIGDGEGKGFNVNVPINETEVEDADFMHIFWSVLFPIASEFQPQLILYSAGFDSCLGDPVGQFNLTANLYACWIHHLKTICTKQLMVLEGGYNHRQQAVCVQRCVEVLLGSIPPVNLTGHRVKQSVGKTCTDLIRILGPFWGTLHQSASSNTVLKSSYSTPKNRPTNTGDINQSNLPFQFGGQEFERRLPKPTLKLVFENEKEQDREKKDMSSFGNHFEVITTQTTIFNEDTVENSRTVFVSRRNSNLGDFTNYVEEASILLEEATSGSHSSTFKLSAFDTEPQFFDHLDVPSSLILKIYDLLCREQPPKVCVLKMDNHSTSSAVWKLIWHLQAFHGLTLIVCCRDLDMVTPRCFF